MVGTNGILRLSRRSLLRRGTFATGAAMIGVAAGSGTVLASDCPRTPGYWRNHDWPEYDPDDPEFGMVDQVNRKVGTAFESVAEGQAFLGKPKRGDTGLIMATHLIATILNFQYRGSDDPYCVDAELDGFEGTVRDNKRAAENWLASSAFPDEQRSWIVEGVDGEPLKDALDAFNNNDLGLDCDCNGSNGSGRGTETGRGNENGRGNGNGRDNGRGNGNGRDNAK